MTAKAIEASSAMLVTSIVVAIITTTTPDHAGVRTPQERSRRSSSDGLDDLTRRPHLCALGGRYVIPSRSGSTRGRIGHKPWIR